MAKGKRHNLAIFAMVWHAHGLSPLCLLLAVSSLQTELSVLVVPFFAGCFGDSTPPIPPHMCSMF
jgi:hypothetical protein